MSVVRAQEHRVHELSVRFPDLVEALRALSLFRAAEVRAAIHAPPYATGSSQSPPQDYHAQAPRRLQAAVGEACAALVRRREAGLLRHAARNGDGFIMSLLRPVAVPVAGQDPKPLVHGVDSLGGLVQTSCVVSDAGELLCIDHTPDALAFGRPISLGWLVPGASVCRPLSKSEFASQFRSQEAGSHSPADPHRRRLFGCAVYVFPTCGVGGCCDGGREVVLLASSLEGFSGLRKAVRDWLAANRSPDIVAPLAPCGASANSKTNRKLSEFNGQCGPFNRQKKTGESEKCSDGMKSKECKRTPVVASLPCATAQQPPYFQRPLLHCTAASVEVENALDAANTALEAMNAASLRLRLALAATANSITEDGTHICTSAHPGFGSVLSVSGGALPMQVAILSYFSSSPPHTHAPKSLYSQSLFSLSCSHVIIKSTQQAILKLFMPRNTSPLIAESCKVCSMLTHKFKFQEPGSQGKSGQQGVVPGIDTVSMQNGSYGIGSLLPHQTDSESRIGSGLQHGGISRISTGFLVGGIRVEGLQGVELGTVFERSSEISGLGRDRPAAMLPR